jgi:trehalose-6-phosphatase
MIFVGDGYTDIPCFSLVKKDGGVSIAVFDKTHGEKWGSAYQFVHDGRVSNLLSANYSEHSDLSIFLGMAVKKLATDIAVSSGTYQG